MPNYFLESKGPDGLAAVAKRQASYDGALGVRGIQSLKSYSQDEPLYDNYAYTITSIYHDGTLKMYISHLSQPTSRGGQPEYYTTQLNTWGMTGNHEIFRQGATAYQNAIDWAKEQRDEVIKCANDRANDSQAAAPAVDSSFGPASSRGG